MFNSARGWLTRLRKDVAGNTLAMAAAALLPLVAAVGGAVDASRYYMATARLQNACDAGALAARKAMGDNNFTEEDRAHGLTFFDHNYPDETFGLADLSRDYAADSEGTVTGTATGNLPTTLMQIFGYSSLAISVTCSAEINISNTDIMFVLDVTGSMNCPDDGSYCPSGNNNNTEASNARIKGLRTAVLSFYDTVKAATSDTAQVRFGIVPYSSNVRVGGSIPTQYMAPSHTYQSREAQWDIEVTWDTVSFDAGSPYNKGTESDQGNNWNGPYGNVYSSSQCTAMRPAAVNDVYIENTIDQNNLTTVSDTTQGDTRTRVMEGRGKFYRGEPISYYYSAYNWCWVGHRRYEYWADVEITWVEERTETREFDTWVYKPVPYPLSDLYTNGTLYTETGYQGAIEPHTWDGCIEEADTVAQSTFDPVPEGANDLLIDLVPSAEDEYWKPQLPGLMYKRESSGNYYGNLTQDWDENKPSHYCPKAAIRLSAIDRTTLENYLKRSNGFKAEGSTYHDIGMIWGGRFITPDGIFAADNATAPNGDAIGRHIVFMTDGELSINTEIYNAYGIEWWDRRINSGTNNNTTFNRHAARFQAACKQARQKNISVWVVAFGTTLTQNLIDCATPGRAFAATDSADLADKFEEIAERIAALRLTN